MNEVELSALLSSARRGVRTGFIPNAFGVANDARKLCSLGRSHKRAQEVLMSEQDPTARKRAEATIVRCERQISEKIIPYRARLGLAAGLFILLEVKAAGPGNHWTTIALQ